MFSSSQYSAVCFLIFFDEASNEKSLYQFDTGTIARVTTLFRLCLAAYASSGFAPMKGISLFQRLKSLSDVTVAPVAPTVSAISRRMDFSAPLAE